MMDFIEVYIIATDGIIGYILLYTPQFSFNISPIILTLRKNSWLTSKAKCGIKANSWEMSYNFFRVQVHISRAAAKKRCQQYIGLKLDFLWFHKAKISYSECGHEDS